MVTVHSGKPWDSESSNDRNFVIGISGNDLQSYHEPPPLSSRKHSIQNDASLHKEVPGTVNTVQRSSQKKANTARCLSRRASKSWSNPSAYSSPYNIQATADSKDIPSNHPRMTPSLVSIDHGVNHRKMAAKANAIVTVTICSSWKRHVTVGPTRLIPPSAASVMECTNPQSLQNISPHLQCST